MTPLPLLFLFFLSCLLPAALSNINPEQADGSGQTAIQDASQPFAGADEMSGGGGGGGAMLGAYYCTTPFWNAVPSEDAACVYTSFSTSSSSDSTSAEESKGEVVVIMSDPCTSLRGTTASAQGKPHTIWYRNVACFAPDEGVVCTVYDGDACTGSSLRIANPGFPDLDVVGWAKRVASYVCVAAAEEGDDDDDVPAVEGGSWFVGEGQKE